MLDRQDCLALLATRSLARVGLTIGALPSVLLVNYRLIGERLYFRTSRDARLQMATTCAVVAFEVDSIDEATHTGWSVVVTGVTEPIEHRDIAERIEAIGVPDWSPSPKPRLVGLSTEIVTGRRLRSRS